ncbi:hypothetical protein WOLCODRAFT_149544 [Wolfiporia cocos MD-104 SS10]|uniref:dUTPase-like domain-containing protein n=1 Tax=Wolfiporia cocos (strain MD-104) TaxID=742152 RepID=A0A2H3JIK4_WOLCO|nr:hypothetical protein WOLCODRAFT_149544 [Wolfiporia cocos MD-104 SS10]
MAHNLEYIRGQQPGGPAHPPHHADEMSVHTLDPFNEAFMDDFGLLSVHDSIHAPTASVRMGTVGVLTPRRSVLSGQPENVSPPTEVLQEAFNLAQNQSNTVRGASQLGPPIQSPLAVQWAFPLNPLSQQFGLACQQIVATMVQTGVWSAEMAGRYLWEAQQVQADALQAGDVASQHSLHSVHATASPAESRFRPVENWVRSVHMGSPGQQSVRGPRPLPTAPARPSPAGTLIPGKDQQQRRKSSRLEKSRSTWAPVLGGEEEQPPMARRDVRLYGEEAQAEGRAQEKQRMAANSRKASKTAAGTVAYDDSSAGLAHTSIRLIHTGFPQDSLSPNLSSNYLSLDIAATSMLRRLEQVYQLLWDAHSRDGIISYAYAQPASPLRGRRQILRLLVAGTTYSVHSTPAFVYASTAQAITTTPHYPSTTRNQQGRRDFIDGVCNHSTELERSGITLASGEGSGAWYRREGTLNDSPSPRTTRRGGQTSYIIETAPTVSSTASRRPLGVISPLGGRCSAGASTHQTNLFRPGYTPPDIWTHAQVVASPAPPPLVRVNTCGAAPPQGTRASMWRPERPPTSQWDAYTLIPEPQPDPRYKSKVREPGDFDSSGFTDWYMWLKLYIDDNAPLLFSDSKRVGTAISMIRGKAVDSWVTAFTREHYLGGQWQISWECFMWELHQKFNDPDLEKKAAVSAEKLSMQAGKGEDYFQELERLLAEAKYDRENQVVHRWITSAIPKEIYSAVHQAFVTATVNDKSQCGYNVKILEDYESWKQVILWTDNVMRRLWDEERLRHGKSADRSTDKGKEHAWQERPKTEPTDEQRANLLKRKCHSCQKAQAEAPGKESPKVLSEIPQEDFVRMVSAWAKEHLEAAKEAGFAPTQNDEPVDGLYGLGTGAPILESVSVPFTSVDSDDDDDGASTCSDDLYVTALEAPPTGAWWEANTVLNYSNINVTYVPMDVDPVETPDVEMADASGVPKKKNKKKVRRRRVKKRTITLDIYLDHPWAIPPEHKSEGTAGYNLYSAEEVLVPNGKCITVDTGIKIRMPAGVYGRIAP